MACLQSICLMVLATLYVACQGQCIIRHIMPSMALMECPSGSSCGSSCEESSSATDDLGALLLLARALEMDKANNANSGIDVNALLDSLIHAMVCIAKPESAAGGYSSGFPKSPISRTAMNSASPNTGHAAQSPPATGSSGSGKPGVTGLLNSVTQTVGGLLDGTGSGGVKDVLGSVTGTVDNLLGGEGDSGDGSLGGVGNTVGGLTGGAGSTVGGLTGGLKGSGGSGSGGLLGGLTGGSSGLL